MCGYCSKWIFSVAAVTPELDETGVTVATSMNVCDAVLTKHQVHASMINLIVHHMGRGPKLWCRCASE